ncbi:MAG: hypothetical protein WCE44_02510 [Candidatus Velthaea sp.]
MPDAPREEPQTYVAPKRLWPESTPVKTPEDAGLGGPSADGDYDNIEPSPNVAAAIADFENRRRRGAETTAAGEMYGDHVRAQGERIREKIRVESKALSRAGREMEQQRAELDRLRQENARLHTLLGSATTTISRLERLVLWRTPASD